MMTDYSKLCRACLTTIDFIQYTFYDNVSPDDYTFCTSVEICKEEILPKVLCSVCYELLSKLGEFKRTCIQSNNILLTCSSIKSEDKNVHNGYNEILNDEDTILKNRNEDWSVNDSFKKKPCDENYSEIIPTNEESEDHSSTSNASAVFCDYNVTLEELKEEKMKDYKGNEYICEVCNKKFSCLNRFEIHKSLHENNAVPKCTLCNKSFVTYSGLRRHNINWHSRVRLKDFKCETCGRITTSRESLAAHQKLHKQRKQYICNVCGRSYATNTNLESHLDTHRDNRERQYTCDLCGKKFLTRQSLVSHISRCHTGKRFICEICSFPFTDKYNLAKHLQKHEGKLKNYICKVCDKSFTAKQVFIEHERIHSGERPYQCKYCPKSFISRKRVTDHHRTHTGEKPHKCNICNHLFTQRGSLTRHMKIHDRPPYHIT